MRLLTGLLIVFCLAGVSAGRVASAQGRAADQDKRISELIKQMETDTTYGLQESKAADELVDIGRPAIPKLVEATEHRWARVRRWAVQALEEISDKLVAQLVARAGNDAQAAKMVGELVSIGEPAIPKLVEAAAHKNKGVRARATRALEQIGDRLVAQMCADADNDIPAAKAVEGLVKMGKFAVPKLIEATKHKKVRPRYWALGALGKISDDRALPAIMEGLKDPDYMVRAVALYQLGPWIERKEVEQAALAMLGDEDAFVRGWTFTLIQEKRILAALPRVMKLLKSEDENARYSALRTISVLKGPEAIGLLKKALSEDKDSKVRAAAVWHLGQWIDEREDVQKIILQRLDDKDNAVRGQALRVVEEKRHAPALPKLLRMLRDRDEEVRHDALRAVVALKGQEAVDTLKKIIRGDRHGLVREGAVRACTLIRPPTPRVAEVLIEALSDEEEEVRAAASELLRKGFDRNFGFFAADTIGDRERAITQWDEWYEQNKSKFRWDPELKRFVLPGAEAKPEK